MTTTEVNPETKTKADPGSVTHGSQIGLHQEYSVFSYPAEHSTEGARTEQKLKSYRLYTYKGETLLGKDIPDATEKVSVPDRPRRIRPGEFLGKVLFDKKDEWKTEIIFSDINYAYFNKEANAWSYILGDHINKTAFEHVRLYRI